MSTLHRWTRTAVRVATTLTRTPAGSQRALHCTRSRLLTAHEVPPVVLQHTSSAASSSSASTPVPPPSREPINPEEYARQQHGFTDGADEDGIEQEDEQAYRAPEDPERVALKKRLLSTAVGSVAHNGWSVEALEAACAELDLPRSTIGDLCPAGPVELVYYTMDDARQRMATHFAGDAAFASEPTHTKVERAMRWRLEQNIPYIQQWSQALALCAQPQQLVTSACKMSEFVNDLAYLCGDDATDVSGRSEVGGCVHAWIEVPFGSPLPAAFCYPLLSSSTGTPSGVRTRRCTPVPSCTC